MRASFTIILLFSLLHALLCVLPAIFSADVCAAAACFPTVTSSRTRFRSSCSQMSPSAPAFSCSISFSERLNNYPTEILLFNGVLILSFSAANFIIFLILYRTLQENKRLELRTQEQEKLTDI